MHAPNINIGFIQERPKKPVEPRKPKNVFTRTESVWSSNDNDILLSDILHLIPSGVSAEKIFIRVEKELGVFHTSISYEYDVPNTKFFEQLKDFEKKFAQYQLEYEKWLIEDAEWQNKTAYTEEKIQESINLSFDERITL